ncbi:MAG: hypothetical protein LBQ15_11300 [Clostridium sp.]|jgi:hypothetical protein|nr:hypothetical protein [Clostridium sp.]
MVQSFFQAVCRIGIFMICAQVVLHFRPSKAYEKYMKMLVSTMILIQVFQPFGRLLSFGDGESMEDRIRRFQEQFARSGELAKEAAAASDAILGRMTLEEVGLAMREKQEEQAREQEEKTPGQEEQAPAQTGRELRRIGRIEVKIGE